MTDRQRTYELARTMAQHDLDGQLSALEALRSRATTALAAGAVTLGVSGTAGGARWPIIVSGAVYAVMGGFVVAILMPRAWAFEHKTDALVAYGDTATDDELARVDRNAALLLRRAYDQNEEQLDHLHLLFRVVCVLLIVEVLLALFRLV